MSGAASVAERCSCDCEDFVSVSAVQPEPASDSGSIQGKLRIALMAAAMVVALVSAVRLLIVVDRAAWREDTIVSAAILAGAAGYVIYREPRRQRRTGVGALAATCVLTAIGALATGVSAVGPPASAAVGLFSGAAGLLLLRFQDSPWTRPLAVAAMLTLAAVLCSVAVVREAPVDAAVRKSVRWASLSLDVAKTPHLAARRSLSTPAGELDPYPSAVGWHGLWPMIAAAVAIASVTRRSMMQAAVMSAAAALTWVVVQSGVLWAVAISADGLAIADPPQPDGSLAITVLEAVLVYLACPAAAVAAAALTDPIPLGRSHADAPVASFLFNIVAGLPGSLTAPALKSAEGHA